MIAAIMLAYLEQIGRPQAKRSVWLGIGAALGLSAVGGILAYLFVRHYDGSSLQAELESVTYLVAAAVLTYMTFWMRRESRGLRGRLEERMETALQQRSTLALATIVFVTVLREGVETVVFTLAIALAGAGAGVITGAALGLAAALAVSHLLYRYGVRINLSAFFNVLGTLLMFSAAGLLADALEDFQQLGWLSFWNHPLWYTGGLLPESSFLGDLLHSFFGYAEAPTLLQVVGYVLYLALVLALFWGRRGQAPRRQAAGRARVA
jgi:high-affinity iron transporter